MTPNPQQSSMFSSPQPDDGASSSRQTIAEAAPISSALQAFAQAHPSMSESIDQMMQIFKQAIVQEISQSQGSEGGMPAYG